MKIETPFTKRFRLLPVVAIACYLFGLASGTLFAPLPDGGRQQRENERLHDQFKEMQSEIDRLERDIATLEKARK